MALTEIARRRVKERRSLIYRGKVNVPFLDTAEPVMELSSTGAIVHSVVAGAGPAIVSSLAAESATRGGLLAVVSIEGVRLRRDLRAIWRGTRLEGPAGDFVRHAQGRGATRRA